jgi:hypothetical protein
MQRCRFCLRESTDTKFRTSTATTCTSSQCIRVRALVNNNKGLSDSDAYASISILRATKSGRSPQANPAMTLHRHCRPRRCRPRRCRPRRCRPRRCRLRCCPASLSPASLSPASPVPASPSPASLSPASLVPASLSPSPAASAPHLLNTHSDPQTRTLDFE